MLMLHTDKSDISQIVISDAENLPYFDMAEEEEWRIETLRHLDIFTKDELINEFIN